jgi:hypothetical protein
MGTFNFTGEQAITRGDDFHRAITFKSKSTGAGIDITNWTFRSQARLDEGQGIILPGWDLTLGSGLEFVDAANGIVRFDIDRAVTAAWTEAQFETCIRYDFEATDDGIPTRFTTFGGAVQFKLDVTV